MNATELPVKGRILIIDDQQNWRDTIGSLLRADGHAVQVLSHSRDLVGVFRKEAFDVVLLDVRLNDRDRDDVEGLAALREIKRIDERAVVVVLTGYPTPEIEAASKGEGAHMVIFKSPPDGLDVVAFRQLIGDLVRQTQIARS